MLDLFGNHIVGFPTRRLNCFSCPSNTCKMYGSYAEATDDFVGLLHNENMPILYIDFLNLYKCLLENV